MLTVATLVVLEGTALPDLDGRTAGYLAASAIVGITLGDTAYFHALARLGAQRAVFLSTLVPPVSALSAYVAFGEALSALEIAGMVLTVSGVTLVLYPRAAGSVRTAEEPRGGWWAGVLAGALAVGCQVAANLLTKEVAAGHSALSIAAARLLFGTGGLAAGAVLTGKVREVLRPVAQRRVFLLLLVATVLGSYLGIWLYMAAIMYADIGVALTLCSTSPIFVVLFAHVLGSERATWAAIAGAAVAVLGVGLLFAG